MACHLPAQTKPPLLCSSPPQVNADLLAKGRGLRISEVTVRSEGADVLTSMSVSLGAGKSRFSAAVDKTGRIYVEGTVRGGRPYLTKIGAPPPPPRGATSTSGSRLRRCRAERVCAGPGGRGWEARLRRA